MKSVRLIKITVWRNATENNPYSGECCDVDGLILSQKRANHTLQTLRQQYLKLCTCVQQRIYQSRWTMVFKCSSVWSRFGLACSRLLSMRHWWTKKFLGLQMDTSMRICYSVWSSTFSVNILPLNCWNFCVWQCVSLNYNGALANALAVSGKT